MEFNGKFALDDPTGESVRRSNLTAMSPSNDGNGGKRGWRVRVREPDVRRPQRVAWVVRAVALGASSGVTSHSARWRPGTEKR